MRAGNRCVWKLYVEAENLFKINDLADERTLLANKRTGRVDMAADPQDTTRHAAQALSAVCCSAAT
jgi:hypothetical protein